MDDVEILDLFDEQMRRQPPVADHAYRIFRTDAVTRLVGPSAIGPDNCVLYSRLDAADVEVAITAEIAFFAALGREFEWKVYGHDRPPDLGERLQRHGFRQDSAETLMALVVGEDWRHPPTPEAEIQVVRHPDELDAVLAVQAAVWEEDLPWLRDALAVPLRMAPTEIEILAARLDGATVATSWMRLHPGTAFASLWGAATVAAARKRGIYSSLVGRHAASAAARGLRILTVDANEYSRPVLAALGFRALTTIRGFVVAPPAATR